MRILLIGAKGFVGSAFHRVLLIAGHEVIPVFRDTYAAHVGQSADVVIDVAGNSRKYFAEEQPVNEFPASVGHCLRVAHDFPAECHLHISSVDVYADLSRPGATKESDLIDVRGTSHYGFHKLLSEEVVRHYRPSWLILRLAGMVGPGLRKNPVYDIQHGQPIRIHPDSQYQFIATDAVAEIALALLTAGRRNEIINVCGDGLISPREIARLADRPLDLSLVDAAAKPRIVNVAVDKLRAVAVIPRTAETIGSYLASSPPR